MENKLTNILLIEDDEVDIQNILRAFKINNITANLHLAKNGKEALEMLTGKGAPIIKPTPNIILLDIKMPVMDGLDFLKVLREYPELKSCSIYILTSYNEEELKARAYNLNVAGYILKSSDQAELVQKIKYLKDYWQLIELPNSQN
ncbi:response regulator [Adhaeribacter aquaticus]|uniref:response regulator n=1 Tax=Adhaeribacter aquaticus TaxID=299567 RepID=UPI000556A488|nr:response regulator [Adhaeribacter aquaticus]